MRLTLSQSRVLVFITPSRETDLKIDLRNGSWRVSSLGNRVPPGHKAAHAIVRFQK